MNKKAKPQKFSDESMSWHIRRMGHIVDRHLFNISKALRPYGLTAPMWRILNGLRELEKPTIGDLATHAALERSYVSRVISRMQRTGLVEIRTDKVDRRIRAIKMTAKGKGRHSIAINVVRQLNHGATAGLSQKERAVLYDLLDRISTSIGLAR